MRAFPFDMAGFARVPLAHLPTPLEPTGLGRLCEGLNVFMKRDDCTGLGMGGNKARKLEFALGDAQRAGATMLLTMGARHSNHVRQTAAAAARLGLRCQVVLHDPVDRPGAFYAASGNYLLDGLFGAEVHIVADGEAATDARIDQLLAEARASGERPYLVPLGASDGLGALGYALCAQEILSQCSEQGISPSAILLATGSGGTQAGLLAGLRLLGSSLPVGGGSVSAPAEVKRAQVRRVVHDMLALTAPSFVVPDEDIIVVDDYVGDGYALPTEASNNCIRRVAGSEGLLLDPVYTAKAMAGMMDLARRGRLTGDVIFLHTGGVPALFAYGDDFALRETQEELSLPC